MITATKKYKKLIDRFALQKLESDEDLDIALEVSAQLMANQADLDLSEIAYFRVLSTLIRQFEDANHSIDTDGLAPDARLRYLMESNGLKQIDLAHILGVSSGRASELANGKRQLSKTHVFKLADRFKVTPAFFLSRQLVSKT